MKARSEVRKLSLRAALHPGAILRESGAIRGEWPMPLDVFALREQVVSEDQRYRKLYQYPRLEQTPGIFTFRLRTWVKRQGENTHCEPLIQRGLLSPALKIQQRIN